MTPQKVVRNMRNRNVIKVLVTAALVGALSGAGAGAAQAAYSWTTWGVYGPINGWTYANRAGADNGIDHVATDLRTNNGAQAPTSYMGVLARALVSSSGAVCKSSSWAYNSSGPSSTLAIYITATGGSCPTSVYLYSKGQTRAYNGTGYTAYSTFNSPVFTI